MMQSKWIRRTVPLGVVAMLLVMSVPAIAQDDNGNGPADGPPTVLPRFAPFVLDPSCSTVELSLFVGGSSSVLKGCIRLHLGDPTVPVPAVVGVVGISVADAELNAPDFNPDLPGVPEPLRMRLNPKERSIGTWNRETGEIGFSLYLVTANDGTAVAPMPLHLRGTLANGGLNVKGDNGDVADAKITMVICAKEAVLPPPHVDVWFSTENGFHASTIRPTATTPTYVSDGDLLSVRGYIVRDNHELTARLGIMPIVPDLGLDAVTRPGRCGIWFSFEEQNAPIWSETLGVWLKHGDLLSDVGFVVRTNEQLQRRFVPMPPVRDVGLDAVAALPNRAIAFSTEEDFFSEALGVRVGHGDLLSERGRIIRTNAQLLHNFNPVDLSGTPVARDYGLDAVVFLPLREIWFSTEEGFRDANLGWISDGDLLSTSGRVVARNLELVRAFGPIEDAANFGLDAIEVVARHFPCDFDVDGDVDLADFSILIGCFNGPNRPSNAAALDNADFDADLDGDGDVDMADFSAFVTCFNGPSREPACDY